MLRRRFSRKASRPTKVVQKSYRQQPDSENPDSSVFIPTEEDPGTACSPDAHSGPTLRVERGGQIAREFRQKNTEGSKSAGRPRSENLEMEESRARGSNGRQPSEPKLLCVDATAGISLSPCSPEMGWRNILGRGSTLLRCQLDPAISQAQHGERDSQRERKRLRQSPALDPGVERGDWLEGDFSDTRCKQGELQAGCLPDLNLPPENPGSSLSPSAGHIPVIGPQGDLRREEWGAVEQPKVEDASVCKPHVDVPEPQGLAPLLLVLEGTSVSVKGTALAQLREGAAGPARDGPGLMKEEPYCGGCNTSEAGLHEHAEEVAGPVAFPETTTRHHERAQAWRSFHRKPPARLVQDAAGSCNLAYEAASSQQQCRDSFPGSNAVESAAAGPGGEAGRRAAQARDGSSVATAVPRRLVPVSSGANPESPGCHESEGSSGSAPRPWEGLGRGLRSPRHTHTPSLFACKTGGTSHAAGFLPSTLTARKRRSGGVTRGRRLGAWGSSYCSPSASFRGPTRTELHGSHPEPVSSAPAASGSVDIPAEGGAAQADVHLPHMSRVKAVPRWRPAAAQQVQDRLNTPKGHSTGDASQGAAGSAGEVQAPRPGRQKRCKRNDGKGWVCREPVKPGHTMCAHHVDVVAKQYEALRHKRSLACLSNVED